MWPNVTVIYVVGGREGGREGQKEGRNEGKGNAELQFSLFLVLQPMDALSRPFFLSAKVSNFSTLTASSGQ